MCCLFNWSWQIYFSVSLALDEEYSSYPWYLVELIVYVVLLIAFVYDDLILLKWLKFKTDDTINKINKKNE